MAESLSFLTAREHYLSRRKISSPSLGRIVENDLWDPRLREGIGRDAEVRETFALLGLEVFRLQ